MRKAFKPVIVAFCLIVLFRGLIFRYFINYEAISTRPVQLLTDRLFKEQLDRAYEGDTLDIKTLIRLSNEATSSLLSFTAGKASNDPNELISLKRANCVGYAAVFASVATYYLSLGGLQHEFEVSHQLGKLNFLGFDLHQFSDNPFFKDHDFNIILNKKTGEVLAIDASVYDYLGVDRVGLVDVSRIKILKSAGSRQ